ncbi:hypothetical protein F5B18DRAFT_261764 [Nemania serpens]|nr:hypothetical protein F5B18DRAFT_261764 [Nemania serpens]
MMGIFSVNMPIFYREGSERAFSQLEEDFMKESDEETLFALVDQSGTVSEDDMHGLLTISPACFLYSGSMLPYSNWGGQVALRDDEPKIAHRSALDISRKRHVRGGSQLSRSSTS